jgi:fatty-acyl-CoA synthase
VAECAVIGVPDARWGEVGKAFVVFKPHESGCELDMLNFLQGKLAKYKIPKSVEIVAALPRTGSGKVDKTKLRND